MGFCSVDPNERAWLNALSPEGLAECLFARARVRVSVCDYAYMCAHTWLFPLWSVPRGTTVHLYVDAEE